MMRIFIMLLTMPLTVSCSIKEASKKSASSSLRKIKIGDSQEQVIAKLGKPHSIDKFGNYHYKYCSDSEIANRKLAHFGMDLLTLGLWEVLGTPLEKVVDCDRVKEVVILFNKEGKVFAAYDIKDYNFLLSIYTEILTSLSNIRSNKNYVLIYYTDPLGWLFVHKNKIKCRTDGYIKAYLYAVPSFIKSLSIFDKTGKVVSHIESVVVFDVKEERYKEPETVYITSEGELVLKERGKEWNEIYPESIQENLFKALTFYCVNKFIQEYKEAPDKPEIGKFKKKSNI